MGEELYHYGVKGMKWGIRRTPQQLDRKIEKLEKKNVKLAKRINPKETEKADRMQRQASKAAAKAASARAEANKNQRRVDTARDWGFDAPGWQKRADKANKAADQAANKKFVVDQRLAGVGKSEVDNMLAERLGGLPVLSSTPRNNSLVKDRTARTETGRRGYVRI